MPVAFEQAVAQIELIAPREMAYEWDNTGVQVRCGDTVAGILIALDVSEAVISEAVDEGCDMILSHHPLIFDPLLAVDERSRVGYLLTRLIEKRISVYSAHTSFDRAAGGINDILARRLGLLDVTVIEGEGEGLLRVGALPQPMSKQKLAAHIRQSLDIETLAATVCEPEPIYRLAVAGGSGGLLVNTAKKAGAQALLTGEAKYSQHLDARWGGIVVFEAGHFETERFFVSELYFRLQSRLDAVQLHLGLKTATCESAPVRAL